MNRKGIRILFVAMANSIHTVRWLEQLPHKRWEIHLFPVQEVSFHPELKNVTVHNLFRQSSQARNSSIIQKPLIPFPVSRIPTRAVRVLESWVSYVGSPSARLAKMIQKVKPDIVHSLEMQEAGYLTDRSFQIIGRNRFPPWIYSSWGSDLYFFGRLPDHLPKIQSVLMRCNYYIADCQRDISLAREYGFQGDILGVFPGVGGYKIREMRQLGVSTPFSARKIIAVKGYHDDNWAGRALYALQALHRCADLLSEYQIVFYLAGPNVRYAAEYVARVTGLNITVLSHVPHADIVKLMGKARIAIGVNISDGTPNSMLEAMVMGAFPIQSDTVSTAEWIQDGKNGFLVAPENVEAIVCAIQRAILDDQLIENAAERNLRMTMEKIDYSVVQPKVLAAYQRIIESNRSDNS
jgi:glycosyltransferase involved in cell wall biosynthesis